MPRRCNCRLCRSKHNQESDSDSQVCREAWAPQQDLLRQCDELRRRQQEPQGPSRSISRKSRNRGRVCGRVERAVQLHTSEGATLRGSLGSCSQASEVSAPTNCQQSAVNARRDGNDAYRGRSRAQQSSNSAFVSRPERRRGSDTGTLANRNWSAFAAARIRRRRQRQQAEVLQALADALRSQAGVLAGLVQGLHSGASSQGQMESTTTQPRGRSPGSHSRRQSTASRMANRQSHQRDPRQRRKSKSSRSHHKDRHI
ncbi:uncharacterized protein LOC142241208 [Haematobia irritans]|uniref:uncharacterized protein LOC142241208 n=1 Tax=Haematobia irritans TaxID=7368 RepID=UPI003F4F4FA7